jgi:hypothetical protein
MLFIEQLTCFRSILLRRHYVIDVKIQVAHRGWPQIKLKEGLDLGESLADAKNPESG